MQTIFENKFYSLALGDDAALCYHPAQGGEPIRLSWPQFEIGGELSGCPVNMTKAGEKTLNAHIHEIAVQGTLACGAALKMELRVCEDTPFVRFRYLLSADESLRMTKTAGENLTYFTYSAAGEPERVEVRFANYDQLLHGYCLNEIPAFQYEDELMGPILTEQRGDTCMLTAYEHGSMYPDKFVVFAKDGQSITLKAVRGNYWTGQDISIMPYETIWLQLGAVKGTQDDLARAYCTFHLN